MASTLGVMEQSSIEVSGDLVVKTVLDTSKMSLSVLKRRASGTVESSSNGFLKKKTTCVMLHQTCSVKTKKTGIITVLIQKQT